MRLNTSNVNLDNAPEFIALYHSLQIVGLSEHLMKS